MSFCLLSSNNCCYLIRWSKWPWKAWGVCVSVAWRRWGIRNITRENKGNTGPGQCRAEERRERAAEGITPRCLPHPRGVPQRGHTPHTGQVPGERLLCSVAPRRGTDTLCCSRPKAARRAGYGLPPPAGAPAPPPPGLPSLEWSFG